MNVVITGATRGIGRAIAEHFAAAGNTIIACARTLKDLQTLQADLLQMHPASTVHIYRVDMENATDVQEFATALLRQDLAPGILINNAGYFTPGNIHSEPAGSLQNMLNINLLGAYHLTRALLPHMIATRQGHIFNICSVASLSGLPHVGAYGISKFALYGFSKHLGAEVQPFGIKVTAVCPGSTYTSSWDGSGVDATTLLQPADVAALVYATSRLSAAAAVNDIILQPLTRK